MKARFEKVVHRDETVDWMAQEHEEGRTWRERVLVTHSNVSLEVHAQKALNCRTAVLWKVLEVAVRG